MRTDRSLSFGIATAGLLIAGMIAFMIFVPLSSIMATSALLLGIVALSVLGFLSLRRRNTVTRTGKTGGPIVP